MQRQFFFRLSTLRSRLQRFFRGSVRIETRTLAVFRVLVGGIILFDILLRSQNFHYFYTDEGVVPLSLAMEVTPEHAFSFFYFSWDPILTAVLFVVNALVALQLIVGYKTRIATVLSFLFLISLHNRNPFILSYGDAIFGLLVFWATFLPLGEKWSVDAVHRDRKPRDGVSNLASAAILLQIVFVYFANAYYKSTSELWTNGQIVPLIMGLDDQTFLLGEFARQFPTLLQYGGLTWYYMLLFSWLLLLLVGRGRTLLVCIFVAAHSFMAVTLRLGLFPYMSIAGTILFLQATFWEDAGKTSRYMGIEPSRLVSPSSNLERFSRPFPRVRLDSERATKAKAALYVSALGLVGTAYLIFVIFAYTPVGEVVAVSPDERIEETASAFRVNQQDWTAFAPNPATSSIYYVFPARTASGELLDVYNNRTLTYDRPYDKLRKQFDTPREKTYMGNIRSAGIYDVNNSPEVLAEYLCEKRSEEHDTEITHINMWAIYEKATMDTLNSPSKREETAFLINQHGCGDNELNGSVQQNLISPPPWWIGNGRR